MVSFVGKFPNRLGFSKDEKNSGLQDAKFFLRYAVDLFYQLFTKCLIWNRKSKAFKRFDSFMTTKNI